MSQSNGAYRILQYNWPIYAGTWVGAAVVAVAAAWAPHMLRPWAWLGSTVAVVWSVVSLLASHYIYDLSELSQGSWLGALSLPGRPWVSIDAGVDPSIDPATLPRVLAGRFDMFDEGRVGGGSVTRARRRADSLGAAIPVAAWDLPLRSGACGTVLLAFAAHEIRSAELRTRFFQELARVLAPGGRVLLVEHVRDLANFLVFGPGYLHFLSRAQWLRASESAGFKVAVERRVTPWVLVLALEKPR